MAGLGDNLLNLSKMRKMRDTAFANLAEPGRLRLAAISGPNLGALRMLSYVPAALSPQAPLVVVLHGCTQNAAAYDHGTGWSALADRHGFALLFPEQQRANNSNLCFNWFQPGDVTRGEGEVASIRQMIAQMVATHGLNPARVYVTGLSAGGAMTAALLATYPDVFAGGAIIAGLPFGSASSMQQAFEAMFQVRTESATALGERVRRASPHTGPRPTVQIWHGDMDDTVKPGNAAELIKQWANAQGLSQPSVSDTVDGARHQAWVGRDGRVMLESFIVPGLKHGTPIDTGADEADHAVGDAGPHILEAGISSTWHIARAWGLLTQPSRPRTARSAPASKTGGVMGVIDKALRTAGLPGLR